MWKNWQFSKIPQKWEFWTFSPKKYQKSVKISQKEGENALLQLPIYLNFQLVSKKNDSKAKKNLRNCPSSNARCPPPPLKKNTINDGLNVADFSGGLPKEPVVLLNVRSIKQVGHYQNLELLHRRLKSPSAAVWKLASYLSLISTELSILWFWKYKI